MRESCTLLTAVVLCLILCLPRKSYTEPEKNPTFSSEISNSYIPTFASLSDDNTTANFSEYPALKIPLSLPSFTQIASAVFVHWDGFYLPKSYLKIYDAKGNLYQFVDYNKSFTKENVIKLRHLPSGLYYAVAHQYRGSDTVKRYAKFVVK